MHLALKWGWQGRGEPARPVYWTVFDRSALNRVSQRLVRKPGSSVKIWRGDDVFMFSSRPLSGTSEPSTWVTFTPDRAIEWLVKGTLTLPGVTSIRTKHDWLMGSSTDSSDEFKRIPQVSDDEFEDAVSATVETILDETGIRITPGQPLPREVDVARFIEVLLSNL